MSPTILDDRQIAHRSETRGIVITRVQTITVNGRTFEARYWTDFASGTLHHVDSQESAQ